MSRTDPFRTWREALARDLRRCRRVLTRGLLLVLVAWGMGTMSARAQTPMSRSEFANLYVSQLRIAAPEVEVQSTGDLAFRVVRRGSTAWARLNLENAYAAYVNNPAALRAILTKFVATAKQIVTDETTAATRDQVVATLRPCSLLEQMAEQARTQGLGQPGSSPLISEPFAGSLCILYVIDYPNRVRSLTSTDLQRLGIDRTSVRELAITNLAPHLVNVDMEPKGDRTIVTNRSGYMASVLLDDKFWTSRRVPVSGDYLVFVVARDAVVITGTRSRNLAETEAVAKRIAGSAPYPIGAEGFVRRGGTWVPWQGTGKAAPKSKK